jgi:hypothetical protein
VFETTGTAIAAGCTILAFWSVQRRQSAPSLGFAALNFASLFLASFSGLIVAVLFGLDFDSDKLGVVWLHILGIWSLVLGHALSQHRTRGRSSTTRTSGWNFGSGAVTLHHLFWTALAARLMLLRLPLIPTVRTGLTVFSTLAVVCLCVLTLDAVRNRSLRRLGVHYAGLIVVSIIQSVLSGHSPVNLQTVVPLLATYLLARPHHPSRVLVSAIMLPALLMGFIAWMDTRDVIRKGDLKDLSIIHASTSFLSALWKNARLPDAADLSAYINLRLDMTSIYVAQWHLQPEEEPFAHGGTLRRLAVNMVPRFLWPDKPEMAGGTDFVSRYTGLFTEARDYTLSVGLPYPFELYANFGVPGVILGLFVVGWSVGTLERLVLTYRSAPIAFSISGVALATFGAGGEQLALTVPAFLAGATIAVLAVYLLGAFLRRKAVESAWRVYTTRVGAARANVAS